MPIRVQRSFLEFIATSEQVDKFLELISTNDKISANKRILDYVLMDYEDFNELPSNAELSFLLSNLEKITDKKYKNPKTPDKPVYGIDVELKGEEPYHLTLTSTDREDNGLAKYTLIIESEYADAKHFDEERLALVEDKLRYAGIEIPEKVGAAEIR